MGAHVPMTGRAAVGLGWGAAVFFGHVVGGTSALVSGVGVGGAGRTGAPLGMDRVVAGHSGGDAFTAGVRNTAAWPPTISSPYHGPVVFVGTPRSDFVHFTDLWQIIR
ncbi:MAG: hypothetical protein GFH27_549281n50 [Chloroflexi bacterium AL-W]|nr:hypothetical protein [Chloroflexi bacterium AL-N1]NOK65936.1 hypothetical protein [Chloroflexi bacterium AL-N10]NOK72817.1 hypothetical protein [Chloroflexi bacterium AL-N5]NOK79714.1 hypothetical protein [Chloroflexi bacterium AL-W]